jgi:hypothetical protein
MECVCTVLFEDPFWIALFEITDEEGYQAARHIFGGLPNEAELIQFAKDHYCHLEFSQPVKDGQPYHESIGFKRRQREAVFFWSIRTVKNTPGPFCRQNWNNINKNANRPTRKKKKLLNKKRSSPGSSIKKKNIVGINLNEF